MRSSQGNAYLYLFGDKVEARLGRIAYLLLYVGSGFAEGKAVENWYSGDTLGLMQQLGVIPSPGQGGA